MQQSKTKHTHKRDQEDKTSVHNTIAAERNEDSMTKERERAGMVLAVASLHKKQDACREDGTETPGSRGWGRPLVAFLTQETFKDQRLDKESGVGAECIAWIHTILVKRLELARGAGTQDGGRLTVYRKLDLFLWGWG